MISHSLWGLNSSRAQLGDTLALCGFDWGNSVVLSWQLGWSEGPVDVIFHIIGPLETARGWAQLVPLPLCVVAGPLLMVSAAEELNFSHGGSVCCPAVSDGEIVK